MSVVNQITKSQIIKPGETFVLPPGAIIKQAIGGTLSTSGCSLPESLEMQCYWAFIEKDFDSGVDSSHPDPYVESFVLGNGELIIPIPSNPLPWEDHVINAVNAMNNPLVEGRCYWFDEGTSPFFNHHRGTSMKFRLPKFEALPIIRVKKATRSGGGTNGFVTTVDYRMELDEGCTEC
jgi:hypothetical protein